MKVNEIKICIRLGLFLFFLSLIVLTLNEKVAIGLLITSSVTFIFGGIELHRKVNGVKKMEKV